MNKQDKQALKEWCKKHWDINVDPKSMDDYPFAEDVWQAALEYRDEQHKEAVVTYKELYDQERERSRRLIEALENCLKIFSLSGSARTILNKALQEYRGEK